MLVSENADVAVGCMMQCATVVMLMWLCAVLCCVPEYVKAVVPVHCMMWYG